MKSQQTVQFTDGERNTQVQQYTLHHLGCARDLTSTPRRNCKTGVKSQHLLAIEYKLPDIRNAQTCLQHELHVHVKVLEKANTLEVAVHEQFGLGVSV